MCLNILTFRAAYMDNHLVTYYLTEIRSPNPYCNSSLEEKCAPHRVDITSLYEHYMVKQLNHNLNAMGEEGFGLLNWKMNLDKKKNIANRLDHVYVMLNELDTQTGVFPDVIIGPHSQPIVLEKILKGYRRMNNVLSINPGSHFMDSTTRNGMLSVQPFDRYRMKLLLAMFTWYDWNFFTVFWSVSMGQQKIHFDQLSTKKKVCISSFIQISNLNALCQELKQYDSSRKYTPRLLMLFTTAADSRKLLYCMRKMNIKPGRYTLIFFYNHNTDPSVYHGYEQWIDGSFGIRAKGPKVPSFFNHQTFMRDTFKKLNPKNKPNDKVLLAYWESRNNCFGKSGFFKRSMFERECTFSGNETLEPPVGWERSNYISEAVSYLPFTFLCISEVFTWFWDLRCEQLYDGDNYEGVEESCTRSFMGFDTYKRDLLAYTEKELNNTGDCSILFEKMEKDFFVVFEVVNPDVEFGGSGVNGELTNVVNPELLYRWIYHVYPNSKLFLFSLSFNSP